MKYLMKSVTSQQLLRGLSLILLLMGLSACSGGGGDSSSTSSAPAPSVALTSSNAEQVTAAALAQLSGGTTVSTISPLSAAEATTGSDRTTTITGLANKTASLIQTSSRVSAAATTGPIDCAINGTVTIDYAADGTSGTITFNNCEDVAGEILDGFISFSNYTESATTASFTASFNLTFSVSGQPDLVLSGGFNVSEDTATSTTTITGTSYTGIEGTETFGLFNFTFVETQDTGFTTSSASFTLNGTFINGAVTVTTLVPFETYDGAAHPHTGEMEILGTNSSRIHVTVLGDETFAGDQVQIEVDADGDGAFETTIMTTWATIDSYS